MKNFNFVKAKNAPMSTQATVRVLLPLLLLLADSATSLPTQQEQQQLQLQQQNVESLQGKEATNLITTQQETAITADVNSNIIVDNTSNNINKDSSDDVVVVPIAAAAAASVDADNVNKIELLAVFPTDELENRAGVCVPIGGRCHLAEQCCSKRCLTFMAKCTS